jgi:dissimilatory sulfite reductase (desulfoviridin) alpha/beta subunit
MAGKVCHGCGQEGHLRKNCPTDSLGQSSREADHTAKQCRNCDEIGECAYFNLMDSFTNEFHPTWDHLTEQFCKVMCLLSQ